MNEPITEEEFILLNHILDNTLDSYRRHRIQQFTPLEQAQLICRNHDLGQASNDDLICIIALMTVRLFEAEGASVGEA